MANHLNEDGMGGVLSYDQHMERLHSAVAAAVAAERERCKQAAEAEILDSIESGNREAEDAVRRVHTAISAK